MITIIFRNYIASSNNTHARKKGKDILYYLCLRNFLHQQKIAWMVNYLVGGSGFSAD